MYLNIILQIYEQIDFFDFLTDELIRIFIKHLKYEDVHLTDEILTNLYLILSDDNAKIFIRDSELVYLIQFSMNLY